MAEAGKELKVYDVAIVGAGIMGSSSAYECAKRGLSVLLLERFDFLHRKGSSHGESRIIRRTYPEDWYTQMMPQAYELWEEAAKEAGYSPLTTTGSLDFGPASSTDLRELMDACSKHQVPHEVLSFEDLRLRFPNLSFPEGTAGVYCAEGGVLHATKACAMMQQLAVKRGADVMDRVEVIGVRKAGDTGADLLVVETTKGKFQSRACVLACGAWTSPLAKSICGVDLPVQPLQVYSTYWRVLPEWRESFEAGKGCPVLLHYGEDDLVYGTPTLEYEGLVKVSSHSGWPCDPDARHPGPGAAPVVAPMQKWMGTWCAGRVDLEPAMVEACMYSMTPDQDFILDVLPLAEGSSVSSHVMRENHNLREECPRVVVAAGFSGHGFKFGPLIGRVVADLVERGTSECAPMERFSARRFEGGKAGNVRQSGPQVKSLHHNHHLSSSLDGQEPN